MNNPKNESNADDVSRATDLVEVDSKASSENSESPSDAAKLSEKRWIFQRALQGVGGFLLFLLAAVVTVSVFMRAIGQGLTGIVELGAVSMVVITVLVIPAVTAADENFRVEVIDFFVGPEAIRRLDVMGLVLQAFVSIFITICAIELFINDVITRITLTGELNIPRMWLTLLVSLGFLAMVHALGVRIVREARRKEKASTFVRQEEQEG